MEQTKVQQWNQELSKCIKCGTCRKFCPIHQVLDDECYTARGKLRLVDHFLQGTIGLTDGFEDMINKCVMCKGCTAGCPAGVDTYKIFLEMRTEFVKEKGLSFTKKTIFSALENKTLFDFGLAIGSRFQKILFKPEQHGNGQICRAAVPMAGFQHRRIIPHLATKTLRGTIAEHRKVEHPQYKVAFFTGCMLHYIYTDIGNDILWLLQHHQVDVITPKTQHCCGTPLFTAGETVAAKSLIRRNLHAFAKLDVDYIICGCGSCGLAWKHEFAQILGEEDPDYLLATQLGEKTRDITEFLYHIGLNTQGMVSHHTTVTYHDSCHLNRGQHVSKQPRQIIKSLPAVQYKELPQADQCCGSGGSFNLKYYEISREINDLKMAHIAATQVEYVVTGCPACVMHIADGLSRTKQKTQVLHTAQLIAKSYQVEGE